MKSWLMAVTFFLAIVTAATGVVVTLLRESEPPRPAHVADAHEKNSTAPATSRMTLESVETAPIAVVTPKKESSLPITSTRHQNNDEAAPEQPSAPETPQPAAPPPPAEDPRSVDELTKTMLETATKDERTFKIALKAFQKKGIEAAPVALELLRTSDVPLIRRMMVYSMQEMIKHDPAHADQLRSAFLGPIVNALESDSDVLTRRWAASALGSVRGPAALDALAAAIRKKDQEFGIEYWASAVLRNFKEPATFDAIEALARDETFPLEARRETIAGMGACIEENPYLLPRLAPLLQRDDLRGQVLAELQVLGTPEAKQMAESAPKVEPSRPVVNETIQRDALERIKTEHPQPDTSAQATFAGIKQNLAGLPFRDRIPTYESHLFSPSNPALKRMILGEMPQGGVEALPVMLRVIREDADLAVKVAAINLLGGIGTSETAKELEQIQKEWARYSSDPVPKEVLDGAREGIYSRTVTSE